MTEKRNEKLKKGLIITGFVLLFAFIVTMALITREKSEDITYDRFILMVSKGDVKRVELKEDNLRIEQEGEKAPKIYKVKLVGDENSLVELLRDKDIEFEKKDTGFLGDMLSSMAELIIPLALFIMLFSMMIKKSGGAFGFGSEKKMTPISGSKTGVTFKDVAGEDEAIDSLREMVDFLKNPDAYKKIGAILPKGALLVGPPGTGKTLLARALAGEANVPFFSISGSEFVEMFVGVGASRVRDLFSQAEKQAPCIIFIDEIDAIGKTRDTSYGGNDEREQTLNQLLSEMDGFESNRAILVLAATNRPEVLDPALLRPGRFDRRIIVNTPDLNGRINILKVHSKDVLLDDTVDYKELALATSGAVGSDLANIINEAAIIAVKNKKTKVSQRDLMEAVEVVLVGKEKKDRILSKRERRIVAYHEVGHALISAIDKNAEPVQKITIIPRTMGALGYVMQVPEEEKYLNTKSELYSMIVGLLGGRAAEEIIFGEITTGAENDIEKATRLSRLMITRYGMSEKIGLMSLEERKNEYLSDAMNMTCSSEMENLVDKEASQLLSKAYNKALDILNVNRNALNSIAEYLIEKETITGKEFMELYRDCVKKRENADGF